MIVTVFSLRLCKDDQMVVLRKHNQVAGFPHSSSEYTVSFCCYAWAVLETSFVYLSALIDCSSDRTAYAFDLKQNVRAVKVSLYWFLVQVILMLAGKFRRSGFDAKCSLQPLAMPHGVSTTLQTT